MSLSAFIHALYEMDMVMVCRYVWRNNSQPKLVVLSPKIKPDKEVWLIFTSCCSNCFSVVFVDAAAALHGGCQTFCVPISTGGEEE